uniref:Uncharacterized protein n=1 Tax=Anguilla anguilla TaxID=7936 RepID=A0A0E9V4C0_ANGAN
MYVHLGSSTIELITVALLLFFTTNLHSTVIGQDVSHEPAAPLIEEDVFCV